MKTTKYLIPLGFPVNEQYSNAESLDEEVNRLLGELFTKIASEGITFARTRNIQLPTLWPGAAEFNAMIRTDQIPWLKVKLNDYKEYARKIKGLPPTSGDGGGGSPPPPTGDTGGSTEGGWGATNSDTETSDEPKKILGMTYKQASIYGSITGVLVIVGIIFGPKLFKKIAGTPTPATK